MDDNSKVGRHATCLCNLQITPDPRYTALPERRCRQLFNQYHSTLKDLQTAQDPIPTSSVFSSSSFSASIPSTSSSSPALEQPSTSEEEEEQQHWEQLGPGQGLAELTQLNREQVPMAGDKSSREESGGLQSAAQPDALDALRQEQARLKAEYDRMEVSMKCMVTSLVLVSSDY